MVLSLLTNSGSVMFQYSYHTRDCFNAVEMEISPSVSQLPICRVRGGRRPEDTLQQRWLYLLPQRKS